MALAEAETAIPALGRGARRRPARFCMGGPMNGIARAVDVVAGFDQMIVVDGGGLRGILRGLCRGLSGKQAGKAKYRSRKEGAR